MKNVLRRSHLLSILVLMACGDSGTGTTEPVVFTVPVQVEVVSLGSVVANATTSITAGAFTLAPGIEVPIEINFLDSNGVELVPRSGEFVEVTVDNVAIGTVTLDGTGAFTGKVKGLTNGTTGVVFRYMYGGAGNASARTSFVSAKINFIVGPAT